MTDYLALARELLSRPEVRQGLQYVADAPGRTAEQWAIAIVADAMVQVARDEWKRCAQACRDEANRQPGRTPFDVLHRMADKLNALTASETNMSEQTGDDAGERKAYREGWIAALQAAEIAIRSCRSLDENGYICEKATVLIAIHVLQSAKDIE